MKSQEYLKRQPRIKMCLQCARFIDADSSEVLCNLCRAIQEHPRKYLKHDIMFFGQYNKQHSRKLNHLGNYNIPSKRIYLDVGRLYKDYPVNYIGILIHILSHEHLHKSLHKTISLNACMKLDNIDNNIQEYFNGAIREDWR